MSKIPATVADAERKPFAYFVQPSSFGPFIECEPSQVGCFPAYRAAPVGADVAASVLLKLCDQLDTMKLRLRAIPDEGQRESYYVADDVNCYVEEARAHWWWASRDGGGLAETVKLPLWIDNEKGKDPLMDDVITWIEANIPATPPATFALGTIVRKKSGSEWEGTIVGTYSSSITPEGYAVESSTHRGSVQIYPVGALELVAP